MQKIDPVQVMYLLVNSLIYGMAKAELKLTGKSTVLSRMSVDFANESYLGNLKKFGFIYEITPDPYETLLNYKQLNIDYGIIQSEDFSIERDGNIISFVSSKCPYMTGCGRLVAEGVKEFNCNICASVIAAAKPSGKRLVGRVINDPGQCKITLEIK